MIPTFEWTIRFGDVLVFIGGITVAATFLYRRGGFDATIKLAIQALTKDLSEMKDDMKVFGQTLAQVSGQEIKINLLMKWYDELRHGKGRIVD